MKYIYIDESGDLGFNFKKKNTPRYFIVSFLVTNTKRPIEKIIKNIHKNLRKKHKMKNAIHAVNEENATRRRFCNQIITKDCYILIISLDKTKYEKSLDKNQIYINMITNVITQDLTDRETQICLIVSKREMNRNFNNLLIHTISKIGKINVQIKTPSEDPCLQAVDTISWCLFREYEYGDNTYSNILSKLKITKYIYP